MVMPITPKSNTMCSGSRALIWLFLCGPWLGACHQKSVNRSLNTDSAGFKTYLQEKFNRPLSKDSTFYVLINKYGCNPCVREVVNHFGSNKKSIFVISNETRRRYFADAAIDENRILVDTTGNIDRLPYHDGNIGIIATANSEIDTIIKLAPQTLDMQICSLR